MVKILRKLQENHETQFPKFSLLIGQKSVFRRYCIKNVKDEIQIHVYKINKESVSHYSQFTSVEVKTNWRKSQAQFWEKLRKLRLKQNDGFLIKKTVYANGLKHTETKNDALFQFLTTTCAQARFKTAVSATSINLRVVNTILLSKWKNVSNSIKNIYLKLLPMLLYDCCDQWKRHGCLVQAALPIPVATGFQPCLEHQGEDARKEQHICNEILSKSEPIQFNSIKPIQ